MKSRLWIIIGMIISLGFVIIIPHAYAQCIENEDWSKAPCFDNPPYTLDEKKIAWAPYYDYKGAEWMEVKKIEMFQASKIGILDEWTNTIENSNVYQYYISTGDIQRQLDYDHIFQEKSVKYFLELMILSSPVIALGLIIVFTIKRKRK